MKKWRITGEKTGNDYGVVEAKDKLAAIGVLAQKSHATEAGADHLLAESFLVVEVPETDEPGAP